MVMSGWTLVSNREAGVPLSTTKGTLRTDQMQAIDDVRWKALQV
eukprot:COSAG05_NODE_9649_length_610_cov_0.906067_2_plen_43_part_01